MLIGEARLQLGELEQVVEHDVGVGVALERDRRGSVLPPDEASLTSAMPSRSPPSTSSWMRAAIAEQLVWYGSSVTTISVGPRLPSSMVAVARIFTLPRPVR